MPIDRRNPDAESPDEWDAVDEESPSGDVEAGELELLLTDAALSPDDPVSGEAVRRGTDPDLVGAGGEEP